MAKYNPEGPPINPLEGKFTNLKVAPAVTTPTMIGNTSPINTSTDATFPTASKTVINKIGAFTNAAVGDLILITGGTGVTVGQYRLKTRTSADTVAVDRNIHASATDITDGTFAIYKDVVTVSATDGVNGQMISNWSHQNRPLQLGNSQQDYPGFTSDDVGVNGCLTAVRFYGSREDKAHMCLDMSNNIHARFYYNGGIKWSVNFDGRQFWYGFIEFFIDNVYDIGKNDTSRPRTIYLGTSLVTPTVTIRGVTGGFTRKLAEATSDTLSGASSTIAVNVPSGARILGVQLRVDEAITSDNVTKTWAADYVNTPTTAITSGQIFDINTKFDAIHPAYEITTGVVTITITPAAGNFTGGIVRGIVYYEQIDAMASL